MSLLDFPYDRNETYVDTSPVIPGTLNDIQDALKILQLNGRGSKGHFFAASAFQPLSSAGPGQPINGFEWRCQTFGIGGGTLVASVPLPEGIVITGASWFHNHAAGNAGSTGTATVKRATFPLGGNSTLSTVTIPAIPPGGLNQSNEYPAAAFSYTVPSKTAIVLEYITPSLNDTNATFQGCWLSFGWPP